MNGQDDCNISVNNRIDDLSAALLRTSIALEQHDKFCTQKNSYALWIVGAFATVSASLFGYILFLNGQQEQMNARLGELFSRVTVVIEAARVREESLRDDIRELRNKLD